MADRRKRLGKAVAGLLVAAILLGLLFGTETGRQAFTPEGRQELVAKIDRLVKASGVFGPLVFILLYAAIALLLPATTVTAAGAFVFGKYLGFLYNYLGAVLSAAVAFPLARYFLRGFASRFLVGRLKTLDEKAEVHGFSVVFYLRMVFFPFMPLNYAAGLTRIRYRDFLVATALGIFPGTFIFSFFFGSLKEIVAGYRGPADLLQFNVLFPAGLFVFSFFLPKIWARLFPRAVPGENGKTP